MQFNSIDFIIFFPIVTVVYFLISEKYRNYWLLATSYFFYMCWNPIYICLLFLSTVVTYFAGILIEKEKQSHHDAGVCKRNKNIILFVCIAINLGLLFYFKYFNWSCHILDVIFSKIGVDVTIPSFNILLPVGISFYTFQALGYAIDVYRDEIYAEKNFFQYALFVSFFPQLVAGPIERSKNLLVQLSQPGRFEYERVRAGLLTMLWGFFLKMVVADRVAVFVNTVYGDLSSYMGIELALASFFFAIQIYCDFMGYSIIAIGAAKVLGFSLMENFNNPYFAISIKDFWRRWHISLSTWLRDYVYIPLGGNRKGRIRKYVNLITTFFVSGLWHGANFTYVIWGLLHGIYQIAGELIGMLFSKLQISIHSSLKSVWKVIRVIVTFVLVDIAWVFFRANTVSDALYVLQYGKFINNWKILLHGGLYNYGLVQFDFIMLLIAFCVMFVAALIRERGNVLSKWVSAKPGVVRILLYWMAILMIIFSMDIGGGEFIYFQF